jgi:hypothetical protein
MRKIVLGVIVAACGGGGGGPIPIHSLFADEENVVCALFAQCGLAPDQASCEGAVTVETYENLTVVAAVDAGKIKYDASAAGQCVSHAQAEGCNLLAYHHPDPACRAIFTGTVAMGGACAINQECANNAPCTYTPTCSPSTMCCMGTCGAPPPAVGQMGATCTTDANCDITLYCSSAKGNTCQPFVTTAGAACDASSACANLLYCDNGTAGTNTCKPYPASGQACSGTAIGCADIRDYCDPGTKVCTRRAAAGQTCNNATGPACIGYAQCTPQTGAGMCAAELTSGQACTAGGQRCLLDLQCTNGTCQLPAAAMACPP